MITPSEFFSFRRIDICYFTYAQEGEIKKSVTQQPELKLVQKIMLPKRDFEAFKVLADNETPLSPRVVAASKRVAKRSR